MSKKVMTMTMSKKRQVNNTSDGEVVNMCANADEHICANMGGGCHTERALVAKAKQVQALAPL